MKKLNILRLMSTVAIAAAGVFGIASVKEGGIKQLPVETSASTPSDYTKIYRFTLPSWFGDVLYVHAWGSTGGHDTEWGKFLSVTDFSYNENDEKVFTLCTDGYSYTGFILVRYADNTDFARTSNIDVGTNTAWSWNGWEGTHDASPWTPSNQTYYLYDYTNMFGGNAKCHAWQSNGSLNTGDYPGINMTKVAYGSGQLYSVSLDSAFDCAIFGVGDSANTGTVWLNHNRGETYCWWKALDGGWSSDMDWIKAHDWVYNTMHVRDIGTEKTSDTGACKGSSGYYKKAKDAYNSFTAAIKTKISQDDCYGIACSRLAAWARANGETASESSGTISFSAAQSILISNVIKNQNTLLIVLLASVVGVGAIGGYFFIRKRKEN